MSFLKNWLPGLILAIPLLCSPWIVETLQAKGRLNAINIDSGRWAGEHQLFLKLGRNPAGDKDYFSSDDLVLAINECGAGHLKYLIKSTTVHYVLFSVKFDILMMTFRI